MAETDPNTPAETTAVYPKTAEKPAPRSGIVWWQVILLILIAISISSNYYLLNWTKEKSKEQVERIDDLKNTINQLKEIDIAARIEEILKNVQQENARKVDAEKDKIIAELTEKIEQFMDDTDRKIGNMTQTRIDQDVEERLNRFIQRLEAEKSDLQRQLSKIDTDLDLEKRLYAIERKLDAFTAPPRIDYGGYEPRSAIPEDTAVLKQQKIYVRDPMQLFSGQVQITLLSADFNSARFSLVISDQRPQMVPLNIGEMRLFDFRNELYFIALHFANTEWAEISITRKL